MIQLFRVKVSEWRKESRNSSSTYPSSYAFTFLWTNQIFWHLSFCALPLNPWKISFDSINKKTPFLPLQTCVCLSELKKNKKRDVKRTFQVFFCLIKNISIILGVLLLPVPSLFRAVQIKFISLLPRIFVRKLPRVSTFTLCAKSSPELPSTWRGREWKEPPVVTISLAVRSDIN